MPEYKALPDLLHLPACKHPRKVCLVEGERSLTFGELEAASNAVAGQLIRAGIKPGDLIIVYLQKSIDAIILFFGILKAGAAYIPLDGNYLPPRRVKAIIDFSRARMIISCAAQWLALTAALAPEELQQCPELLLFGDEPGARDATGRMPSCGFLSRESPQAELPPAPGVPSHNLAYILFTSGSSGLPKGVMISHRNALAFIEWALGYFRPREADVFSSHAPFHFDLSVFDIFVSLACGGCLKLIPFRTLQNPRLLWEWLVESGVSFWYSVPSAWIIMLNHAHCDFSHLEGLRQILFAGEAFPVPYLKQLMEALPRAAFYNLYGPTETNVCTAYRVPAPGRIGTGGVPIGSACSGAEILVLDSTGRPVGPGSEGELCVMGPTVTAGYYREPEKTEKAFIPSPLAAHQGAKLYRTGDLVRRLAEDNFLFLGRRDRMSKISGFRIEMDEIVAVLLAHEGISEAAVTAVYRQERGTNILIAFITANSGARLSIIELKQYCLRQMPYYMVPENIILLEKIYRNSNGKVDYAELLKHLE